MAPDSARIAEMPAGQAIDIVLEPISHPDLGEIRIEEGLFAIGRTEAPFDSYAPEIVADLSRRHARIFSEYGGVYVADLDSKNGTTVNGVNVRQKITRLQDGDEIAFAGRLSYRIRLGGKVRASAAPERRARLQSLTLTPERGDLDLQPIVITRFPFLISKADEVFSRYKERYPHQVNYLSRRHAHIFVKGDTPFVEDLGSTNGTFVSGTRLDEHAVPLNEGDVLALGGHHFVYQVSLEKEEATLDPTVTKLSSAAMRAANAVDADKTTFVAAPGSFLDIFCVDQEPQREEEIPDQAQAAAGSGKDGVAQGTQNKFVVMARELATAFGSKSGADRRRYRWAAGLAGLVLLLLLALALRTTPEAKIKDLLAHGDFTQAAAVAGRSLAQQPDNAQLKALGAEAELKANLPRWQTLLKARDFERANTILQNMKKQGRDNADLQPLLAELDWVVKLDRLVAARGGADKPINDGADEARIKELMRQWDEDAQGHQRNFTAIAAYVPEFRDTYAEVLSHVRKLALVGSQSWKGGQGDGAGKPPQTPDGGT